MATGRALDQIELALNEGQVETLEGDRVQQLVDACTGEALALTVDSGGGLHDRSGVRVGAIRRGASGEWIVERQNPEAHRAEAAIPYAYERGPLRRLLSRLVSR